MPCEVVLDGAVWAQAELRKILGATGSSVLITNYYLTSYDLHSRAAEAILPRALE